MKYLYFLLLMTATITNACNSDNSEPLNNEINTIMTNKDMATIISVTTSGSENNYTFRVGISSPDTGCEQYADWWEVITEEGILIYRRILAHSHVNEQPFIRSGGTINITKKQVVIIRAHMNTSGYGVIAFKGSIENGFKTTSLNNDFAKELATVSPLPTGCNF